MAEQGADPVSATLRDRRARPAGEHDRRPAARRQGHDLSRRQAEAVGPGTQRGPGQDLEQDMVPAPDRRAHRLRVGCDPVALQFRIGLARRADPQPRTLHGPLDPHVAQGTLGHPLPESRPWQPRQEVGRPAADVLRAVIKRGFEQRLVCRSQRVGQDGQEHDPVGRARRVPAGGDQGAARVGVTGQERGQVASSLPGITEPPRFVVGRGLFCRVFPVRVEVGQPAGSRPARLGQQPR